MNIKLNTQYLVYLLKSLIVGEKPEYIPEDLNIDDFFEFCAFHKVENMVYVALKDCTFVSSEQLKKFRDHYMVILKHGIVQEYYREAIAVEFEKHDIDYLFLKGKEISALYPVDGLRQSADVDIYVGRENAKKARDIMLAKGFEIVAYGDSDDDHDEYINREKVFVEIHRVLIQNNYPWRTECNKITGRLLSSADNSHQKKMGIEDFYVYNLAHTAKHMRYSGIGIRAFLDLWDILRKFRDSFNIGELEGKLKSCNLFEFDKYARKLCEFWFEEKTDADEKTMKMAAYVAASGWVGTEEQAKATEVGENSEGTDSVHIAKFRKCLNIIMAPYESMCLKYPILIKHKWLTPFYRLKRAFCAIVFKRDLIKKTTGDIEKDNMEYGKDIMNFKKSIGL